MKRNITLLMLLLSAIVVGSVGAQNVTQNSVAAFDVLEDGTALPIPIQREYDSVTTYKWTLSGVAGKTSACARVDINFSLSFPGTTWQPGEVGTLTGTRVCPEAPADPANFNWRLSSTPTTEFTGTRNGASFSVSVTPTTIGEHRFVLTGEDLVAFTGSASRRTNVLIAQVGTDAGGTAPWADNFNVGPVTQGATETISLSAHSGDTDSANLTWTVLTQPSCGTLFGHTDGDGTVQFTASATFTGSCNFTYQVHDGDNFSRVASVTITIQSTILRVLGVELSAGVTSGVPGVSTSISFTASYAEACTGTGPAGWVTSVATLGPNRDGVVTRTYSTGPLNETTEYGLTCTLGNESMTKSVTVTVSRSFDVSLIPNETNITNGESVTFTLTSAYGESCTATGPDGWVTSVSGVVWNRNGVVTHTYTTPALSANQTYTATCTSTGYAPITRSVTITVDGLVVMANAGGPYSTTLPDSDIRLSGSYTLSNPPANFTPVYNWSKVSGPGTVAFSSTTSANPDATFSVVGTYVLRFSVTVATVTDTDDVTIVIYPESSQNRPPTGSVDWDDSGKNGGDWSSSGCFIDPDGDALTVVPGQKPSGMVFVLSPPNTPGGCWPLTISWSPAVVGMYDVSWEIRDGRGGIVSLRSVLHVAAGNPPVFGTPVTQVIVGERTCTPTATDSDHGNAVVPTILAEQLPSWFVGVSVGDNIAGVETCGTPTSIGEYGVRLHARDLDGENAVLVYTINVVTGATGECPAFTGMYPTAGLQTTGGLKLDVVPGATQYHFQVYKNGLAYVEHFTPDNFWIFDPDKSGDIWSWQVQVLVNGKWCESFRHHFYVPTSTEAEGGVEVPTEFALHGNYPNPFNPTTTITFDLPEASSVQIRVFDTMGRQVFSSDGEYTIGRNEIQFSGDELPSGMYLYRVSAKSGYDTGRMILQK